MKPLSIILSSFIVKMDEILGSFWGWILTICCAICNFLVDFRLAFIGVVICVIWDAIAGIWAAVKQGKYARSELMRDTFSKLFAYGGALVMMVFIERMIGSDSNNILTNIVGACICATEMWSIGANMLIVNPNLKFFKVFKSALIGEIARKLGLEEEQVREAMESEDKEDEH